MACACPCFGDEADAEEKPNQMIQLDGLGMLRLDTQHVGQGSQGARSAKWFYFGETDDRLAVVNMLLCITCFLMWILAIWAVSTYYPEANPSGKTNDLDPPKRLIQLDGEKNAEGIQTTDTSEKFKRLQAKLTNDLLNANNSRKRLKTEKDKFKEILDKIQVAVDYKGDKLAKLPDYIQTIRTSKDETDEQLKKMRGTIEQHEKRESSDKALMTQKEKEALEWKTLAERWKPYANANLAQGFEITYRMNPNVEVDELSKSVPVLYKEFRQKKRLEEPKDGDDPKRNNEFAVNNTNDVGNQKGYKEPETNDDNQ